MSDTMSDTMTEARPSPAAEVFPTPPLSEKAFGSAPEPKTEPEIKTEPEQPAPQPTRLRTGIASPDNDRDDGAPAISRFRPIKREMTKDEIAILDEVEAKLGELETVMQKVKSGRYHVLAMTSLEEAVMWLQKEMLD